MADLSGYAPEFMDIYKTQMGGNPSEWLKNLPDVYKKWQQDQELKNANAPSNGKYLGANFNWLTDTLKGNYSKGLDMGKYRNNAAGLIGKATNRQVKNTQENLNASGLSRAGVGYSVVNDIYGKESEALAGVENNLINQDIAFKQNSIAQLLGLNQFEGQQNLGEQGQNRNYEMSLRSFFENQRQFNAEMDAQPEWWESLLGNVVGGASQAGTAALIASDERLKENIKKVGNKGDVEIVEFNYKGHPQKFRGVVAQQIEENHPEAVSEIDGIKYVDYSKIDVKMEAINA
jgi:hypothetical protein